MAIKMVFTGFEDMLADIEKAEGNALKAAESAMGASAKIMHDTLKAEMKASGVSGDLINRMPKPYVSKGRNKASAEVGYVKGSYNERNPSDGYKVVFLNYGTPHRSKHGKVVARGFIARAKRKAAPKIKKAQQEALHKVLMRLE